MKSPMKVPYNGPTMQEQAAMAYWWLNRTESINLKKKYSR